jgi:hypothetical protein
MKIKLTILILILSACGPAYNLKQAKKHLLKAESKGAKVERDTVYKEIITTKTVSDTVVKIRQIDKLFTDTLTIETTKWKTWTRIDTVTKKVFQMVECKPDTIRVPIAIKTDIKAGYGGFQLFGMIIFGLVVGALAGRILWK